MTAPIPFVKSGDVSVAEFPFAKKQALLGVVKYPVAVAILLLIMDQPLTVLTTLEYLFNAQGAPGQLVSKFSEYCVWIMAKVGKAHNAAIIRAKWCLMCFFFISSHPRLSLFKTQVIDGRFGKEAIPSFLV
jgi:hypothetical protein